LKKCDVDYTLYLCTDRELMSTDTLEEAVTQAIEGGCTVIQLREKNCSSMEFYRTAMNLRAITRKYNVPFIINDRVDIALAVDADGVHVGQEDLPAKEVRRILGPDKILGVSAARLDEAVKAVEDGADYLGVGAMYPTGTKTDARPVTMEELREIRRAVEVPIVVIGGINLNTLDNFKHMGINGLAVVSAVIAADDIKEAAGEMAGRFREK
jgi:thiamine-phosphate pyrophosphorylase